MIRSLTDKDTTQYKTIFFDLDGTVTESGEGCMNGVKYMLEKIEHPPISQTELRAFLGPPMELHLMDEYGFNRSDAAGAYTFYKEYYETKGMYENRLFNGIQDMLIQLKRSGKTAYIATSKPEHLAVSILDWLGVLDLFANVFGARHDLGIYGKTQVLKRAVDTLGEAPQNPVMVGDRYLDAVGARDVGFDIIGVLYGYGDLEELVSAKCDYIVDSVSDLSMLLGRDDK